MTSDARSIRRGTPCDFACALAPSHPFGRVLVHCSPRGSRLMERRTCVRALKINLFIEEEPKTCRGYRAIGRAQCLVGFPVLEGIRWSRLFGVAIRVLFGKLFAASIFRFLRLPIFENLPSAKNIFYVRARSLRAPYLRPSPHSERRRFDFDAHMPNPFHRGPTWHLPTRRNQAPLSPVPIRQSARVMESIQDI